MSLKLQKELLYLKNFSVAFNNVSPKPLSTFTTAYKQSPIVPLYYADGKYGVSFVELTDLLPHRIFI
jgi:hypothetical protein